MAQGTTLLSYEMGWQLRLFDLAAASQQVGDYVAACNYGIQFLNILGLADSIPKKQQPLKGGAGEELKTLQEYYFNVIGVGLSQIAANINKVRNDPKYRRDGIVPLIKSHGSSN